MLDNNVIQTAAAWPFVEIRKLLHISVVLLLVVPFSDEQDAGPACFAARAHSWFNCSHVGSTECSVRPCQPPCAWLTPFTKLASRPNAARTAPTLDTRAT